MYPFPPYVAIVYMLALVGLAGVIAAAIVETVGKGRLARWLRLDVRDDDR